MYDENGNKVVVLKEDTQRERGKNAQASNIKVACIISDAVKSTLGVSGLDKMLVDSLGDVIITNDGATILKEIDVQHPTAKIIVDVAKSQDEECGDGPQPLYAKVLTPNGFKLMGNIKVGDVICGTNGTKQKVIGVFPKGKKRIYKIKFADGRETECCKDHIWTVFKSDNGTKCNMTTEEMFKNGIFRMEKNGYKRHKYYVPISQSDFNKKKLPLDPYFLGVLLGDGSLVGSRDIEISLGKNKEFVLSKIKLPKGLKLKIKYIDNKNYFRIKVRGETKDGKSIKDILKDLGLFGCRSNDKFIPKTYLYSDYNSRIKLLEGLSDTDGYMNKSGLLEYSTVSDRLCSNVLELMRGLGKVTHHRLHKRDNDPKSYSNNPIYRITELKGYKYGNKIVDIVKTDKFTNMQCIKVSNDDNLYFTDDYILTHNTTSVVVLTGELLRKAKDLLDQNIHPTVIVTGYQLAAKKAKEVLKDISTDIDVSDRVILKNVAKTSMSSKSISSEKDDLSDIVVDAVTKVAEKEDGKNKVDLDNIKIQKVLGSSINNTKLVNGLVIEKKRMIEDMPSKVTNANVALIGTDLEVQKTKNDAKINISNPNQLQDFLDEEEKMMKKMITKITENNINVVFCSKAVDDFIANQLNKKGIVVFKRTKQSDLKKLSKMLGKRIVTDITDLTFKDVAKVKSVEQKTVGDTEFTFINNDSDVVTIMLFGTTTHVVDEVDRAMHDALFVTKVALEDGSIVPGGGAVMVEIAKALRKYASSIKGREQMAIMAYADAIEVIPKALAENGGLDSIDILLELRAKHDKGKINFGVDSLDGKTSDMLKKHVIEPLRLGLQEIDASTEAATMILRIDDVISTHQSDDNEISKNN